MTINLSVLGTYATGIFNSGAAESAAYDGDLQRLFVVNRTTQAIDVLSLSDPADPFRLFSIDVTPFGPNPSSVAVSSTGIVAVAVEGPTPQEPGSVVFFDTLGQFLGSVPVGATPRALTFTPDGSRLLVANAGEPSADYTVDPEGSISIIDLTAGPAAAIAQTVGFAAFNEQQATLSAAGVRIFGPGASVAQDLEPEAIALSGDSLTAYITLQENNAVATLDLATATITEITPLGTQDHSLPGNELDASNIDGAINIAPAPVQGLYQPGAIATYTVNGETFWVLANEGASRASVGFNEEATVGGLVLDPVAFPPVAVPPVTEPPVIEPPVTEPPVTEPPVTGPPVTEPPVTEPPVAPPPVMQQIDPALGNLTVSTVGADIDGNGAVDQLFSFGSRSFSIRTAATNIETAVPTGSIVYDSGAAFEQITAAEFPQFFNADNTINTVDTFDARSDDSGPEPNGIVVGQVGDRTYSFTTLEQIGGVVVYDITDPANASFVQYINNRDFSGIPMTSTAGDLGPENPTFIAAEDSPTGGALLAIPNAVSGTTSVYGIFTAVDESTEVIINEIRTNQPGANSDHFFELLGTPNTSLDGLTYIVIGDGDTTVVDTDGDGIADATAGSGVIEEVVDLSGSVLNGDGLFVAAENTFTLGSADLTTTLNFEDNDNVTHLLVRDFTGGLDQDLDTDDDGVLDVVPWTEIFDSVAIVRSTTSGEQIYSESIVGPLQGIFAPGHVFRQPVEDPEVPEEPPIGEMPGGEVPGEEPPVGEMPVGEVPGGEVPGEEQPVGGENVGEEPVVEVPG
ncbi:MAG: choice-of-anchor I family protein [Elainellaceae cyanobacterium]